MKRRTNTWGGARKNSGRKSNESKGLEKRSRVIALKLTEAEYEALVVLAEDADDDVSSFVRTVVLGAV